MTESTTTYAVGRGKPPLHTRFQKGQSGNPSGRPGPAKLAKQRFQRALYAALDGSEAELEQAVPGTVMTGVARRLALAAVSGRVPAMRLLLSLLDAESGKDADDAAAEQLFTGAELFSLLQGKKQGNGKDWLEEILRPDDGEKAAEAMAHAEPPPCGEVEICERSEANFGWGSGGDSASPHPKNARTERMSATSAGTRFSTSPQGGGTSTAVSLVQGKMQGSGNNPE